MGRRHTLGYLLKGYPRLSETFISNEILYLEELGFHIRIYALRNPGEPKVHASASQITAPVSYIPDHVWRSFQPLLSANWRLFLDRRRIYWRALKHATVQAFSLRSTSPLKRFVQAAYLVQEFLGKEPVSHLHAHFANDPTMVAFFVRQLTGIQISFTAHAKDIYSQDPRLLCQKIDSADFVITCTDYNRRVLEKIGRGSKPTHLVYHGVNLDAFASRPSRAVDGAPLILSVGRFVPKKGFPVLIKALRRLVDRGVSYRCRIIGAGPQRVELLTMIRAFALEDRVELVEPLTSSELLGQYDKADVFALACQIQTDGDRDGIPNVLVEAMAVGLPIVSTSISGIPELIENGVSGLLVPPRDPAALATALERLVQDPEWAATLARTGQARVRRHFDIQSHIKRLETIFDEALEKAAQSEEAGPALTSPVVRSSFPAMRTSINR